MTSLCLSLPVHNLWGNIWCVHVETFHSVSWDVCVCLWRPEDNLGCHFSVVIAYFFLEGSSTGMCSLPVRLDGLVRDPLSLFSPPSHYWDKSRYRHHSHFTWVLGIKFSISCLLGKHFTGWDVFLTGGFSSAHVDEGNSRSPAVSDPSRLQGQRGWSGRPLTLWPFISFRLAESRAWWIRRTQQLNIH